jgi:hypothetical protein
MSSRRRFLLPLVCSVVAATSSGAGCGKQLTNRQVAYGVVMTGFIVVIAAAQSGYHYSSASQPQPITH